MASNNYSGDEVAFLSDIEDRHYWYRSRRGLLDRLLRKLFDNCSGERHILDLGCGNGSMIEPLSRAGKYYGADYSKESVRNCFKKGANVTICDARQLGFASSVFDLVAVLDLLEHVEDDNAVLLECYRVLKPGGYLVLFIPAFSFLWTQFDYYSYHKRRYQRRHILRRLKGMGFSFAVISYFFVFLFLPVLFCAILERIWFVRSSRETVWEKRLHVPPGWLNSILLWWSCLEADLAVKGLLPFGTSIIIAAKK